MKKYLQQATQQTKNVKAISVVSLLIALNISITKLAIPLTDTLKISFKFLTNALTGLIGGPFLALISGFITDNLSIMVFPSKYPYFIGYTFNEMLGVFIYALFFFKQKITIVRIILARISISLFCNVLIGSYLSSIIATKSFAYYFAKSIIKNGLLLPVEITLIVVLFKLLLPLLNKLNYTNQKNIPIW